MKFGRYKKGGLCGYHGEEHEDNEQGTKQNSKKGIAKAVCQACWLLQPVFKKRKRRMAGRLMKSTLVRSQYKLGRYQT